MHRSLRLFIAPLLVVPALAGCAATEDDPPVEAESSEIGITLNRAPDGVNCIGFTLLSNEAPPRREQFALTGPRTVRIASIGVGAYELSAVAFRAPTPSPITDASCQAVPAAAPWTTQAPIVVVVQRGLATQVNVTLVPAGRINITPSFFIPPEVIAQGQGNVGSVAAARVGDLTVVRWLVKSSAGANGQVRGIDDGTAPVEIFATAETNPEQVFIVPQDGETFWTNSPTRTTDSNGVFLNDGSVVSNYNGVVGSGSPADVGYASANGTFYWGDLATGEINCYPCAEPFATGQSSPNTLTAFGNRVYWAASTSGGSIIRGRNVTDIAPQDLANIAPFQAYGMTAADDDFVYYVDFDTTNATSSNIRRVPRLGGAPEDILTGTNFPFPITLFQGFIYYLEPEGIRRVSVLGGDPEPLAEGSFGGFAVMTDANGRDLLYYSDTSRGGLIWRARL